MFSKLTRTLYRYRFTILVFVVLLYRSSSLMWVKEALGVAPKRTGRVIETRLNNPVSYAAFADGCDDPYEDTDSDYNDDGCTSCTAEYDEPDYDDSYDDGCSGCESDYESDYDSEYDDGCSGCDSEYETQVYYEDDYDDDGCAGCNETGSTGPAGPPPVQRTVRFVFTIDSRSTVLLRISGVGNAFEKILVIGQREPDVYEVLWYGYMDTSQGVRISDGSYRAELTVNNLHSSKTFSYSEQYGFSHAEIIF